MAIFHLSVKRIGGNSGRTSVGAAAYHAGKKYRCEYDGLTHDYSIRHGADRAAAYHSGTKLNSHDFTHKGDIIHSEVMLPKHAPEIFKDAEILWNSVESSKKQDNEQTARMVVIALPNELTPEQNIEMVRNYVKKEFVDEGMCADFSIHAGHIHNKKDKTYPFQDLAIRKDNPHAHIQLTTRPLNEDGTWANKTRKEYILDKNGNRIRQKNGKGWQNRNINLTDWEKGETLVRWRKNWADTVNRELERLGIDERISHLSLKEQGIDREPTIHMGHKAWNLEKKGIKTEVGNKNRDIMTRNKALEREKTPEAIAEDLHELKQGYIAVDRKISAIQHEINDKEREKMVTLSRAEDIGERAEHIKSLRMRIVELKANRQDISLHSRSYEQAENYFTHEFAITPMQAPAEINRLETKADEMEQAKKSLEDRLPQLLVDRENFKAEYHRILASVHRDRKQILDKLEQLERETIENLSPKEKMARLKITSKLDEPEHEKIRLRERYRSR